MKLSPDIANLIPYKPGKPISETQREYGIQDVIKLASNENPLGTSPKVVAALKKALDNQHRYPDPSFYDLIECVHKKWSVPKGLISVGNGSNEIIDLLIRIFCEPGDFILTTEHAFVAYAVCAQAARVGRIFSKLASGYKTDLEAMAEILEKDPRAEKIKIVFIPNPNNPTGTYVGSAQVDAFLKKFGNDPNRLIVFDEAYTEYARAKDYKSAVESMAKYSSVAISRTLSKAYGLAGMRVGILLAQPQVIDYFNRVRNPFNVNDLAQVAAVAAMQDDEFISRSVENNSLGLDYFYEELRRMNLPYVESQGNFVMFNTLRDVSQVHEGLLRRGVILRPILNYGFKTELRMTVGLPQENQRAIQALKDVFAEVKEQVKPLA
jgi:histidinol-phosphate aminotransferase